MELSLEQKEKNYCLFINKLQTIGVDTTVLENNFKKEIMDASYGINNFLSVSGEGTLLHIILRVLTPLAIKVTELTNNQENIKQETLIKICLLSHLSKAQMFKKNESDNTYGYAPYPYAIRMGLRSVALCQKFNINLTEEEIEAFTIIDGDNDDEYKKFYSSPLANIVKIANDLTNLQLKKKK